jgi:proteic killer suppression protein
MSKRAGDGFFAFLVDFSSNNVLFLLPFLGNIIDICMTITYKNNRLEKQLSSASEIKKNFGVNAKRLSSRLDDLVAATTLAVLIQIPAANCHLLSGNRAGQWAVSVSGAVRLILEINDHPVPKLEDGGINTKEVRSVCIVEVTNYH